MLSWKKEKKNTSKGNKANRFWIFFHLFSFSLPPSCSDLTGISKVPDLGQIWTFSTDALKQEKSPVDKLGGFFCEEISTNGPHFKLACSMA